jgi:hypothetical protein
MTSDWFEVIEDLKSGIHHLGKSREIFQLIKKSDRVEIDAYIIEMAFMHSLQCGYHSIESGLTRALKNFNESMPDTPIHHEDVIRRCKAEMTGSRPPIISDEMFKNLRNLKTYVYVATKSHHELEIERAEVAVKYAGYVEKNIMKEMHRLIKQTDPDACIS